MLIRKDRQIIAMGASSTAVDLAPAIIVPRMQWGEVFTIANPCDLPVGISIGGGADFANSLILPPGEVMEFGRDNYVAEDIYGAGPSDGLEVDIINGPKMPGKYGRKRTPNYISRTLANPDLVGLIEASGDLDMPDYWVDEPGHDQSVSVFSLIQRGGDRFTESRGALGSPWRLAAPEYLGIFVHVDGAESVDLHFALYESQTETVIQTMPTTFQAAPAEGMSQSQVIGPILPCFEFAAPILANPSEVDVKIGVLPL